MKKDKIIVLQSIPHLESHLIIKGLNGEGRVFSFFCSCALKSKKRFPSGVLEPGGYIKIEYRISKNDSGWNYLHEAEIINKFRKIRESYDRLELKFHFLKMVNKVGDSLNDPEVFHLLGNGLTALETTPCLEELKLFFEIRFLFLQGVLPQTLQSKSVFFEKTIKNHSDKEVFQENTSETREELNFALENYLN